MNMPENIAPRGKVLTGQKVDRETKQCAASAIGLVAVIIGIIALFGFSLYANGVAEGSPTLIKEGFPSGEHAFVLLLFLWLGWLAARYFKRHRY